MYSYIQIELLGLTVLVPKMIEIFFLYFTGYANPASSRVIPEDKCAVLPNSKMLPTSNFSGSSSL